MENGSIPGGGSIEHLAERGRFRVVDEGGRQIAELDYTALPGIWDLTHTYSDPGYRGTGLASVLVTHVMDQARAAGVTIVPSCPYIPVWLSRHPDYVDLVAR
ncbi:N-acetyltransferase [Nakamurella sp. YIM 132087]|uniref:N-acetyltransferase n=1 Tax=Nakamurella alba TaxID=2665158 RepID=A0A7K1FNP3_9ACTN|nr:GNAT family N-acetyltransferase [Nakamurella alba]MTD15700.1 N-acetyltransferase [Nakamurella alba]